MLIVTILILSHLTLTCNNNRKEILNLKIDNKKYIL
jgi:hypothetical protein